MIKNQSISLVRVRYNLRLLFFFSIVFVFLLAQGPLMITGPGMGMYQQGGYAAGGIYPTYGGAPGYPGY